MATKNTKQERIDLKVEPRTIFGKKLKALRKEGILPANVYGEGMESQALQLPVKEFYTVYKKAHETHIVYLLIGDKELPVLIQNIQRDPISDILFHVDFRKVNLKKKIETDVPVNLVGESEAVNLSKGILLSQTELLKVEALPEDLPAGIDIDISVLKELNDEIRVKDVKVVGAYELKDDPEKIIVRITEHKEEDTTPQIVAPETVEITSEKKDEEGADGESAEEAPKEGKESKEEKSE
ncbi:MAG TPA: 50S ribosomal protein L25 [Candidatus Nitrosocosmicus sp.]|nr:50S ribosomal protein L25 [Candidatus Nitrosocosmicus sp.]